MSRVTVKYFVADISDPLIEPLFASALATVTAIANRRAALVKKYGAELSFNRGDRLNGFGYQVGHQLPISVRKETTTIHDGANYIIAVPNKRSNEGKNLAREIDAFNRDATSFSDIICTALDINTLKPGSDPASPTGMSMYHSACGQYGKRLVFKIPFGGEDGFNSTDVSIPPALKEIKHSEFIAIVEEGQ